MCPWGRFFAHTATFTFCGIVTPRLENNAIQAKFLENNYSMSFVVEHSMFTNVKNIYLRFFFSKSVELLKISFYFCKNIYKNICKSRKIFSTTTKK